MAKIQGVKSTLAVTILLFIVGVVILLFAFDVTSLWIFWLIGVGILIGRILSFQKSAPYFICSFIAICILGIIIYRALPIHSLSWSQGESLTISNIPDFLDSENWSIGLTDPNEIETFKSFGKRGHYETFWKGRWRQRIFIGNEILSDQYYIYGNGLGKSPSLTIQSIFIPEKEGFTEYLEGLLKKYGHSGQK